MGHGVFPWQLLGAVLVARGLLTARQLELALDEQRRTGRLLGQILVTRGWVSAFALGQGLGEQHGVELRAGGDTAGRQPGRPVEEPRTEWRPLGRVLVAKGLVTLAELERALAEQERRPERRLGEILVRDGRLSGVGLASALAEQHGVALAPEDGFEGIETVLTAADPGGPRYRVHEARTQPTYRLTGPTLFESANFLEAADFAIEYVDRERPAAMEIRKAEESGAVETVWTYSERRADAVAAQRDLVRTFGFDPTRWDAAPPSGRDGRP
jgi:hypothetical protein